MIDRDYRDQLDEPTRVARGVLLGLALGAAMWAVALAIAVSLGAFS